VASFESFVSDVRVADGEMCAIPAWKYVSLDAATWPEAAGPMMATTLLSATYFCASVTVGAGPASNGVSPARSLILRPYFGASVLTAYFAQLSCSLPIKPPPPVSGVTTAILSVLLQLKAWVFAATVDPAPAVDASAAATMATNAIAIPPRRFIPMFLLDGCTWCLTPVRLLCCTRGSHSSDTRAMRAGEE